MALHDRASVAREPLTFALGSPAKVAALRTLVGTGEPVTQRDLARRAGIQHRSAQAALETLVQMGLVTRQIGGRDHLVSLNAEHRLAAPLQQLFAQESQYFAELRKALAKPLSRRAVESVVLFGSTARETDGPESDCDLLVVARDADALAVAMEALEEANESVRQRFGRRAATIGYSLADASRRWKAGSAPFKDIRRDGVLIYGRPLNEVLGGED